MRKKIFVSLIAIFLITLTNFPLTADNVIMNKTGNKIVETLVDYPDDFTINVFSGGTNPWSNIFILEINNDGSCTYSAVYSDDRATGTITIIDEFQLTISQMDQVWLSVQENDYFDLDATYEEEVTDGSWSFMKITANNQVHTVETYNIAVPRFDEILKTINSVTPGDYDIYNNAFLNYPPDQPEKPSGELSGKTGKKYTYTTQTIDPNDDEIYYLFNWGDGSDSGWIGPYESEELASAEHTWEEDGNYSIWVSAKDDPNKDGDLSDGMESRSSAQQTITMPLTKFSYTLFQSLLHDLVESFPILEPYFSKFYEKNLPITIESLTHAGTTVERNECEITVTIHIQIWGPGATDGLATEIKTDIEKVWNTDKDDNSWSVECEDDCERQEPGCSVKFVADVKKVDATEVLPGYHDIFVRTDTSGEGYSTVWVDRGDTSDDVLDWPKPNDQSSDPPHYLGGTTDGTWDNNEPDHTWAHEAGHLLGLDDTYTDTWNDANGDGVMQDSERTSRPNPGHENDIMANLNGKPLQSAIDAIVDMGGVECPCDCCPEEEDDEDPENEILSPENGAEVTSPVIITGYADDHGGSGIVLLDYTLFWDGGSYDGSGTLVDPPKDSVSYTLGPLDLYPFIETGDWINITIIATDDAGNSGSDSITVTLVEDQGDTIPPVTIKTIGEPNQEDGYVIWPYTPINLHATDEGGSGVNYIHYEIKWDKEMDGIWDETFEETIYLDDVMIFMNDYQISYGLIQLSWYAVDNAENIELTHLQEHMVIDERVWTIT